VLRFTILVSVVFASAGPAVAGYFPSRPHGVPIQHFTGVISEYGLGNGNGSFTLIIRGSTKYFYIGLPMKMNGTVVQCRDPDPALADWGACTDWPSKIVLGKSIVTATCWSDSEFVPGTSTLFCDEIDYAVSRRSRGGHPRSR
jgi:hypothetical protein